MVPGTSSVVSEISATELCSSFWLFTFIMNNIIMTYDSEIIKYDGKDAKKMMDTERIDYMNYIID